jgi:hypothetical protein
VSATASVACSHCGSKKVSRLFSRVAVHRSGESFDGLDESALAGFDENDPKSMAKYIRKMSHDMGEPLDAEMEHDLERMEAGELPGDDAGEADSPGDGFASVD